MIKKVLLWILVIGMSITIFCFSAVPGKQSSKISKSATGKAITIVEKTVTIEETSQKDVFDELHRIVRKCGHFLEFAILSVLTFCLARSYNLSLKASVIIALSYCLLFAIGDEVHQLFVKGRKGRRLDVLIDFLGSCVGAGVCLLFIKMKKTAKQKHS